MHSMLFVFLIHGIMCMCMKYFWKGKQGEGWGRGSGAALNKAQCQRWPGGSVGQSIIWLLVGSQVRARIRSNQGVHK